MRGFIHGWEEGKKGLRYHFITKLTFRFEGVIRIFPQNLDHKYFSGVNTGCPNGSVLASVNSAEENESFWQFMQDNNYCKAVKNIFIGVHKDNGIFKNIDGSPLV